jgi:hypothetical protein
MKMDYIGLESQHPPVQSAGSESTTRVEGPGPIPKQAGYIIVELGTQHIAAHFELRSRPNCIYSTLDCIQYKQPAIQAGCNQRFLMAFGRKTGATSTVRVADYCDFHY